MVYKVALHYSIVSRVFSAQHSHHPEQREHRSLGYPVEREFLISYTEVRDKSGSLVTGVSVSGRISQQRQLGKSYQAC